MDNRKRLGARARRRLREQTRIVDLAELDEATPPTFPPSRRIREGDPPDGERINRAEIVLLILLILLFLGIAYVAVNWVPIEAWGR